MGLHVRHLFPVSENQTVSVGDHLPTILLSPVVVSKISQHLLRAECLLVLFQIRGLQTAARGPPLLPVSVKVFGTQPHSFIYLLSPAAVTLRQWG